MAIGSYEILLFTAVNYKDEKLEYVTKVDIDMSHVKNIQVFKQSGNLFLKRKSRIFGLYFRFG